MCLCLALSVSVSLSLSQAHNTFSHSIASSASSCVSLFLTLYLPLSLFISLFLSLPHAHAHIHTLSLDLSLDDFLCFFLSASLLLCVSPSLSIVLFLVILHPKEYAELVNAGAGACQSLYLLQICKRDLIQPQWKRSLSSGMQSAALAMPIRA